MSRSVWKGPFVDAYVLKKAEASRESGRNEVIKIWSRRSTILPQFVGLTFGVYNGQKHVTVNVTEDMIGQKRFLRTYWYMCAFYGAYHWLFAIQYLQSSLILKIYHLAEV